MARARPIADFPFTRPLLAGLLTLLGPAGPLEAQEPRADGAETGRSASNAVVAPSEYLGFPLGADFRLAGWDSVLGYLNVLAAASPELRLDTLGSSTEGRPFVLLTATSSENMRRLDAIRANQARLADPRALTDAELEVLRGEQPVVVLMLHNIHSTEVASSQGGMELAHSLATDPDLRHALDRVVVLVIPSANPDGLDMVVDWYRRTLGSPYEGSPLPWLYHRYTGHDNNRDWFMLTQVETRLVTDLLYRKWFPEVVYDVHEMGSSGARFFVPPFDDPVNPNIDPLQVRLTSLFGLQISTELEAAGKAGVVDGRIFDLWWHGGARTAPARHNMIGLLSEAAGARLASPIFQEPRDLDRQPDRGVAYPHPWSGGWWRLRDIIEYQMIAARAVIGLAARQRPQLVGSYVELGRRAVEAGRSGPPFAYIVPALQRDPGSAATMLEVLRLGGVELHRASGAFSAEGIDFAEGSHVVFMAQPYRAHALDLLERQYYPERRAYPGGPPEPPYDVTGWTLPLQMGVEVVAASRPFDAELEPVSDTVSALRGPDVEAAAAYAVDYAMNAANRALHRALVAGADVVFLDEPLVGPDRMWPVGTVILRGEPSLRDMLADLAEGAGLVARPVEGAVRARRLGAVRIGLYQPWTASIDEGWTRWVFDTWELPYRTVHDADIRAGALEDRFDVIVLPDLATRTIVEGRRPGTVPREYAGGIGPDGVDALMRFVQDGGTLVCLDSSSDFAIEVLGVPVSNVRPGISKQRRGGAFYAPGSIFRIELDPRHPLAYGMPSRSIAYYANGPVFELHADAGTDVGVAARFPATGQLLSGFAVEPEYLARRPALLESPIGAGRVILFGFRPQHRGQSHETFKLLFNAVYRGSMRAPAILELR